MRVAIALAAMALMPHPQQLDPMEQGADVVSKIVAAGGLRDFVLCRLQHAVWGNYDVRVFVSATTDRQPRVFEIKARRFLERPDPAPDSRDPAREERDGKILIETPEEAFKRGVPFFIQFVRYQPPDLVHLTVFSNPAKRIDRAWPSAFFPGDAPGDQFSQTVFPQPAVASATGSQNVTLKDTSFRAGKNASIWLLRGGSDFQALQMGCLVSNELEVRIPAGNH